MDSILWRLVAVTTVGTFMTVLDTTVVNVALLRLSHDLHTTLPSIQWVVTAYLLALGAAVPVTGWATRRFGAKRVYLASLVLFTLGSGLCGVAWSTGSLVVFRLLQGVGGGILIPVGQTIVYQAAGPDRMRQVAGVSSVPVMLAPILGPTLGGLVLDHAGWSWIFLINVPVGVLGLVLAVRLLPDAPAVGRTAFDWKGFVLAGTGVPLAVYALAKAGEPHPPWTEAVACGAASAVLIAAFVLHARRARVPLLDVGIYRNRGFSIAAFTTFVVSAGVFGSILLMPLWFQTVRGLSAALTGLLIAPQAAGAAVGIFLVGRVRRHLTSAFLVIPGVLLLTLGTIPFLFFDATTPYWVMSVVFVLRGMGIGLVYVPTMVAGYAALDQHEIADATPQVNVLMRVGSSVGVAVIASLIARELAGHGASEAFQRTYLWVLGLSALTIPPALVLVVLARRRYGGEVAPVPGVELA